MRCVPVLGVLSGPDGECPPLPFLEIEDGEAASLIERGLAAEYEEEAKAEAEASPNLVTEPPAPASESAKTAGQTLPPAPVVEPQTLPPAPATEPPSDTLPPQPADERAQHIADAIDLLEADHFVKSGPRAGKPKVEAIADIAGLTDVTADEIDAALAAKAAEAA